MPLKDVATFAKSLGGTATNVAVGAARLGHRTRGADQGRPGRLRRLRSRGADRVRRRRVVRRHRRRAPDAGGVLRARTRPRTRRCTFYRAPIAPDLTIDRRRRPLGRGGRGAGALGDRHRRQRRAGSHHPARHAGAASAAGPRLGPLDGARPRLAADVLAVARGGHGAEYDAMLDHVTVTVGNRAEVEVAVGTSDPARGAPRGCSTAGVELALVKLGGDGVLVATAERRRPSYRRTGSRSSAASAPATRSAARWCTGCFRAGRPRAARSTPTPPVPWSRAGWPAPTPCRRRPRSTSSSSSRGAHA